MDGQRATGDQYASGMIHSSGDGGTPNYDKYQFSLFKKYLGGRILEIGAGGGRISNLVIRDIQFEEFVISEPSPNFMARLKQRFAGTPKTYLAPGELDDVAKMYPSLFDVTFSVHVMEHVEDHVSFVRQQLDLLRPGGRLIILVPALQFLYSTLDKNIGHFRRYNKSSLRAVFKGMPVRIDKLFYSNFLGVIGSLYFSRIRKVEYQSSESERKRFFKVYQIFSQFFVPVIEVAERFVPVPIGLNLTLIATKK